MNSEWFRFRLGDFECVSVSDGNLNYPLDSFFHNAPREQLVDELRQMGLPTTQVATPYTLLYVDTGKNRVMIDTGAGELGAHAAQMFPTVDHSTSVTGRLVPSLRAAGIEPGDIDTVLITHAHPDHVAGTLISGQLAFPNAQYFVPRVEYDFWMSEAATQAPPPFVSIARQNMEAMRERMTLIEDGMEVVPGICAVSAYGHTPGHTAFWMTSKGEALVHISDVALYPLHLKHPDWMPAFDMNPEQAMSTKRRIMNEAADKQALVFAHHFPPFPNVGHVVRQGEGWEWQPMEQ